MTNPSEETKAQAVIKSYPDPIISKNISYNEGIYSEIALKYEIPNRPNIRVVSRMRVVAARIFEPLRKANGDTPIKINSFYRSLELNEMLTRRGKSSEHSQHMRGEAIDINMAHYQGGMTNAQAFNWIWDNLDFDQLIWEYGDSDNPQWIHVSCKERHNRKQVLIKTKSGYTELK